MTKSLEDLERALDAATDLAALATVREVKRATHLLCRLARDEHPTAVKIRLEPSDQGDWMALSEVLLPDGTNVGLEDDMGVTAHLYQHHLGSIPGMGALVEDFFGDNLPSHPGMNTDQYEIDIQTVLDEFEE